MYLQSLSLFHFRNYDQVQVELAPGRNVVFGENGQGKTNLLEAVYLLFSGKSFRTSHLQEVICKGQGEFAVEAAFNKHNVVQTVRLYFDGQKRKVVYNGTLCSSPHILLGLIQGVLLAPSDLSLIRGAPQERRLFLDLQNAQADPLYVHHLHRFQRALKQRNVLLKARQLQAIDPFEEELAKSGAYLCVERYQTIAALKKIAPPFYEQIAGSSLNPESFNFNYKSLAPVELGKEAVYRYYLNQMQQNRPKETVLGITLSGPHREDVALFLNEGEAKKFASEGQAKSMVSALRLAEWTLLRERSDSMPLMLIDDLTASLDKKRRDNLLSLVANLGQVLITTTDPAFIEQASDRLLFLKEGNLQAVCSPSDER